MLHFALITLLYKTRLDWKILSTCEKCLEKIRQFFSQKFCNLLVNLWKNLGEYGLQSLLHQNAAFNELIHKLYALSYVPPDQVIPLYKEHIIPEIEDKIDSDKDWSEQAEDLEEFGFYYENTWIEKR